MKKSEKRQRAAAFKAYRVLVDYCQRYSANHETCAGCLFDDNRPKCCCIANIPPEWYEPRKPEGVRKCP